MSRSHAGALVLTAGFAMSACGSLYHVGTDAERIKGVPFYVKKAVCKQEQVYIEPLARVTLTRGDSGSEKIYSTIVREEFLRDFDFARKLEAVITDLKCKTWAPETIPDPPTVHYVKVANTAALEAYVDYSRPYYLNVKKPWIGSSSATAEIAPDGTLARAEAKVEDDTVERLAGVFPIGAALASRLGIREAEVAAGDDVKLRVHIESLAYRHTFTKLTTPDTLGACTAADGMLKNASYRREEVRAGGGDQVEPENAISVSGTILLPKKE